MTPRSLPMTVPLLTAALFTLPATAFAAATFDANARLEITFTGASQGIAGNDYSVGASQPFTPSGYATGNAVYATDEDVFPGGVPGMAEDVPFYVDLDAGGNAGLPFGNAGAEVLGAFGISVSHFGVGLGPITFDFDWNLSQAVTIAPGAAEEFAGAYSLVSFGRPGQALIDSLIDLDSAGGPLTDGATDSGSFSVTLALLESVDYSGLVQVGGEAMAPYAAPAPSALLLLLPGLLGVRWCRRQGLGASPGRLLGAPRPKTHRRLALQRPVLVEAPGDLGVLQRLALHHAAHRDHLRAQHQAHQRAHQPKQHVLGVVAVGQGVAVEAALAGAPAGAIAASSTGSSSRSAAAWRWSHGVGAGHRRGAPCNRVAPRPRRSRSR